MRRQSMLLRQNPSPEWEACLKTRIPWGRTSSSKNCRNSTIDRLKRNAKESQTGKTIKSPRTPTKFQEPIWVISWLKLDKLPNLSSLPTDTFLITSKAWDQTKLRRLSRREKVRLSTISLTTNSIKTKRLNGQFKIWRTTCTRWTTSSSCRRSITRREMKWETTTSLRIPRRKPDGQTCTETRTHYPTLTWTWIKTQTLDRLSEWL